MENQETLNKADIDSLIDKYFLADEVGEESEISEDVSAEADPAPEAVAKSEESESSEASDESESSEAPKAEASSEPVEKAADTPMKSGASKETADEVKAKKSPEDPESKTRRPLGISDVPDSDQDGNRAKGYEHIQYAQGETPNTGPKGTYAKSYTISQEDFDMLQEAKEAKKQQAISKANSDQELLIKSAVGEAVSGLKEENQDLKKTLEETLTVVKSLSKRPQIRKSISNIQAVEREFGSKDPNDAQPEHFTKSEMLDAAVDLCKAGKIKDVDVTELEMTGRIYDPEVRRALEKELKKSG